MSGIVAFVGPSLPLPDRARFSAIDWRPPAEAGDLLRLVEDPPATVCLVDGFFDHRPAVRHKELLLLLSRGIRVFGAASIGALRAAEMASFGMIGIGAIYRAFADGRLTRDDEVALAHGPQSWDWRPLSVPLVEVRATLCRAVRMGVLPPSHARRIRTAAAAIHYADRQWADLAKTEAGAFGHWVEANAVGLKRADALACIEAAAAAVRIAPARPACPETAFLRALARDCGASLPPPRVLYEAAPSTIPAGRVG